MDLKRSFAMPERTLEFEEMGQDWKKRARSEVKEPPDPERNVQVLKERLLVEKDLRPRTDNTFLMAFLRARKHDIDKAFKMVKRYYEVRQRYPEFYKLCLPGESVIFDLMGHVIFPNRDHLQRAILLVKPGNYDVKLIGAEDIVSSANTTLQVLIEDPKVQIAGVIMILDLDDFSLYHQSKLITPTNVWVALNFLQDTFPMRLQSIHIVNEPWFFDALYAIFRPFLKEKLRKRIVIHGRDMSSLHRHLPASILPKDYGGNLPAVNQEDMISNVNAYIPKIKEWHSYGYEKKK